MAEKANGAYGRKAFIVYQPGPPGTLARVNISAEAETVLAFSKAPGGKSLPSRRFAVALCSRWVSLLGKRLDQETPITDLPGTIDIMPSHRRKYEVQGIVLDGRLHGSVTRYPSYLFILNRATSNKGYLQRQFREKRLSPREKDLATFLFSNKSIKEIGQAMGLSPNTIKGYLKSLALKLGVSSRIGILVSLYKPEDD